MNPNSIIGALLAIGRLELQLQAVETQLATATQERDELRAELDRLQGRQGPTAVPPPRETA
jgi:outer membrane protein TolC